MRFFTNLVPLRLEPSESASLGNPYNASRVRLNYTTLPAELFLFYHPGLALTLQEPCINLAKNEQSSFARFASRTRISGAVSHSAEFKKSLRRKGQRPPQSTSGKVIVKAAPCPGVLSAVMVPFIFSTSWRTMDSPRPLPFSERPLSHL